MPGMGLLTRGMWSGMVVAACHAAAFGFAGNVAIVSVSRLAVSRRA